MDNLYEYSKIANLFSVAGKIVLITGTGGLASLFAQGFHANGASIILASRSPQKADSLCQELNSKSGGFCRTLTLDVSDLQQVQEVIDTILADYGRLDICIHTAALCSLHPLMEDHTDLFQAHMDVNMKGTYHLNRLVGQAMAQQGWGRIININTMSSTTVNSPDGFSYGVTKTAMRQITRYFAIMLATKGVTVNELCPIWVKTPMMSSRSADYWKHCLEQVPMERAALPQDHLGIALYMASEAGRFMTGQSIFVDGGWSVSRVFKFDQEEE